MAFRFRAELWMHTGEAAWYFVTLPHDVADAIADEVDERADSAKRGFGSVRVVVTIGDTTWSTSVFPDKALQSYVLPVKKQVRAAEDLDDGSEVEIALELVDGGSEVRPR